METSISIDKLRKNHNIKFMVWAQCLLCLGSGNSPDYNLIKCKQCNGLGYLNQIVRSKL